MATREILQFAGGGGANVLTQGAYAALTTILANGYPAGILDSNLINKTLRQSNFMAVGLAQALVNAGISVPDDGDVNTLAANIALILGISLSANNTFTKAQRGAVVGLTDAATINSDFNLSNNFSVTLAGNRTLAAPTNLVAGQSGIITITQDATGSRTLAFNSAWKFPGGAVPSLTTAANAVDELAYYVNPGATTIFAILNKDVK